MSSNVTTARRQRGVALFVGLVFLVVLSVVAVIAMQGTLLEMRMVNNVASSEHAFETSETMRTALTTSGSTSIFEEHIFNRGWPASWSGDIPDDNFDFDPSKAPWNAFERGLTRDSNGHPELLYGSLQAGEDLYAPNTWKTDVMLCLPPVGNSCNGYPTAALAVVPDGTVLSEGSGGAQAAGYRGIGSGAAGGGASKFFEVMSVATAAGNGRAVTISQYRIAVRN
ncbi:hypothetical protein MBSD_n2719 [Mizugakiibacter sediminis]|uniref:Type 4 fimbrial biogenesis protein PilX N-terminal domain-containing protein n=1 Tax=Mizugakiibacter sediminis TaxID=1475481 RepID=A0A0K8QRU9_9GAMM|nr:PilX N-terminal domain-containing pilus assembly protein [Mizugakiibacter sediminis]GAP67396.1 hypothetical protein MBSD_n2719 [Mizugakiibacter sediminis]